MEFLRPQPDGGPALCRQPLDQSYGRVGKRTMRKLSIKALHLLELSGNVR